MFIYFNGYICTEGIKCHFLFLTGISKSFALAHLSDMKTSSLLADFVHLFFPDYCAACGTHLGKQEESLCLACLMALPRTRMHDELDNPVERIFWGRANVSAATAFLRMPRHGMVHHMVHELKYNDNQAVGVTLGKLLGDELKESERLSEIDLVVPVPLHPGKLRIRGYNQCDLLADGLAESMGVHASKNNLRRTRFNASQTHKSRYDRWKNSERLFALGDPESLAGMRVLLVDDVITTGATIEACLEELGRVPRIRLHVAALALPVC
jgi:ComF family protein